MVVHFDPWWNPAVEDQATDRAYRIGQQQVVQVFKLVTRGTIEEKYSPCSRRKRAYRLGNSARRNIPFQADRRRTEGNI